MIFSILESIWWFFFFCQWCIWPICCCCFYLPLTWNIHWFFFFYFFLFIAIIINDDNDNNDDHTIKRCTANEFECIRDSTCIDLSSVGDGIIDCIDSSDECPDPIQQFRCRCGIPICIDRKHYMDGQINCDDGSDEGLEVTICQSFIQNELLPNGEY